MIRERTWPVWAKRLVTMGLIVHLTSVLMAELAYPPTSPLLRRLVGSFVPYYEFLDQGHAHRFYSDIGPTAILTAELRFGDGRPNRTVRLPDRSVRPRMVYQRQLALANSVFDEVRPALSNPNIPLRSGWGESFARHLCLENPGCTGVTLRLQQHENPHPGRLIEAATVPGIPRVDPDAEEFYTTPTLLGDFPCPPK
ncbi:MAG: hypothetical protein JWN86_1992 [Planctomycetota bacterium]|nr:hypothetical protein [Planctomycetota bacterium]